MSQINEEITEDNSPPVPFFNINPDIDFSTVNQWSYWEMRKRLFFLPELDLTEKIPAVKYLLDNKFYLLYLVFVFHHKVF